MAAPTGSIANVLQNTLPVAIDAGLEHIMAECDPAFDAITTSMDVVSSNWGRDYEIKKAFSVGLAGHVQMDANQRRIYGEPVGSSGRGAFVHSSALSSYPNPRYGANPEPQLKTIGLAALTASLMFTKAEADLAALPNQQGRDIIPKKMMGFMENVAQVAAIHYYTAHSAAGICAVASVATAGAAATTGFRIILNITDGNVYRLRRGMQVDAYPAALGARRNDTQASAANQTQATRKPLVVDYVNYAGQTATLWMPTAVAAAEIDNIIATDVLFIANSRADNSTGTTMGTDFFAFNGINTFLINTGTVLGINVAHYPEFASLVKTGSGTLTEQYLRKLLSEFQRSMGPFGYKLDTALTTRGVYNGYLANKIGSERRDRTSQPLNVGNEGTAGKWRVTHDGLDIKFGESDYCTAGHLYITKTASQNWKRYVPPAPAGVSKSNAPKMKNREFEFVGPELGWNSNKIPFIASDGTPQDAFSFYGRLRMQMVPDQLPGIKVTDLTEDNL